MECIISTEATCDLTKELINKYNIKVIDMDFIINNEVYSTNKDSVESTSLYKKMKSGAKVSTSQINEFRYYEYFKELLKFNLPIVHISLSGNLSATSKTAIKVAKQINETSETKVYVIDSLCACSGQGFLAILCSEYADKCNNERELIEYAEKIKFKINHIFTVENLKYLANGGRIKQSTAFFGNVLNIKPLLKADNTGKLVQTKKVVSRKKALVSLFNIFKEINTNDNDVCFISHADCLEDANLIKELIYKEFKKDVIITNLGPIIGSHSGPGTIAMFYLGGGR